jgi:hypothetical protein
MKLSFERVGAVTGPVVATAGPTIPRGEPRICAPCDDPLFVRQRPAPIPGALTTRRGEAGRLATTGVLLPATDRPGRPMGEKYT